MAKFPAICRAFRQISRGCYNGESFNGFYGGLAKVIRSFHQISLELETTQLSRFRQTFKTRLDTEEFSEN